MFAVSDVAETKGHALARHSGESWNPAFALIYKKRKAGFQLDQPFGCLKPLE